MAEHSPEPWRHIPDLYEVRDADGDLVCGGENHWDRAAPGTADGERIVACINFCRHQSTEFLQQHRIVPIKSKDDITTDRSRPDFGEFKPALFVAVMAESEIAKGTGE